LERFALGLAVSVEALCELAWARAFLWAFKRCLFICSTKTILVAEVNTLTGICVAAPIGASAIIVARARLGGDTAAYPALALVIVGTAIAVIACTGRWCVFALARYLVTEVVGAIVVVIAVERIALAHSGTIHSLACVLYCAGFSVVTLECFVR